MKLNRLILLFIFALRIQRKAHILLCIIMLLAAVLRFWSLSSVPPSLTWDEVAWGYNAYSLGQDGRDEFGKFLPITYLESFGDFKPPLYAYLAIIPVKIFGLTEFATRFPSALFGVLTVLVTYFLVKKLFGEKRKTLALLATGVLAISPWHIMLSRAAFEANLATFFIVFGVYAWIVYLEKGKWLLTVSAISFVLSMYAFNSARFVAPLLVLVLFLGTWKRVLKDKKSVITAVTLGFVIFFPLAIFLTTPQAKLRYAEVNIFSDLSIIEKTNIQIARDNNALFSRIIHNRRFEYAAEYLRHYFDNLTPQFLFVKGDGNPKFSTQDIGELYLWEIPFFLAGAFLLFRKREKYWWVIPIWLVIGIAPAATARETPHALRIESSIPTFQIITAVGIYYIVLSIRKVKYKKLFATGLSIVILLNFTYFIYNYFVHYSREFSGEWQYGYKEAISYANSVKDSYDYIYFTKSLGRPYAYVLFYSKYDPKDFRKEAKVRREVFGFVHVEEFEKYRFFEKTHVPQAKNVLIIDTPGNIPGGITIQKEFRLLNGDVVLVAYTL